MQLNVTNETNTLKAVVLGQPISMGRDPLLEETYDAKSYDSIQKGIYPSEKDITYEMSYFEKIFLKYNIEVFRPDVIENYNQVFSRDIAFVIDDKLIIPNIISDRQRELEGYHKIFEKVNKDNIITLPKGTRTEGGDIILYNDIIFCGAYLKSDFDQIKTARTNAYAIDHLRELFPHKTFIPIQLKKNDKNPYEGVLHLDCTFMIVGKDKAIIYKDGLSEEKDYQLLKDMFGEKNIFEVTKEEMYHMNTNIVSLSPNVIVSEERFTRLNNFLEEEWNITVERIPYHKIGKMGGLLRCSTLPLIREK